MKGGEGGQHIPRALCLRPARLVGQIGQVGQLSKINGLSSAQARTGRAVPDLPAWIILYLFSHPTPHADASRSCAAVGEEAQNRLANAPPRNEPNTHGSAARRRQ